MGSKRFISVLALLPLCLIGIGAGCSDTSNASPADAQQATRVLKVLGIEYARFMAQNGDRPPANQEQLAAFLESRKDAIPGLTDVAQLLVSPRDSQPLVIFYGKVAPPPDDSGFPVIAREASGASGSCLVANTRGGVHEISADQLPSHLATAK
jgi:hypothetical protein